MQINGNFVPAKEHVTSKLHTLEHPIQHKLRNKDQHESIIKCGRKDLMIKAIGIKGNASEYINQSAGNFFGSSACGVWWEGC